MSELEKETSTIAILFCWPLLLTLPHCTRLIFHKTCWKPLIWWSLLIPSCHQMPQQSTLDAYFPIATPEQIVQSNEWRSAQLCNSNKMKQAFAAVSTALRAENLIEKQCKSSAQWSWEYCAHLKAATKSSRKQVGLTFITFYHHWACC